MKKICLLAGYVLVAAFFSSESHAKDGEDSKKLNEELSGLEGMGFGPALYYLHYSDRIIEDSTDVRLRGNGTLEAHQARASVVLGLETHANLGWAWDVCSSKCKDDRTNVVRTWGFTLSPYVGLFDVSGGINGFAFGGAVGLWKADKNGDSKKYISLGIGGFTHKGRMVLADDVAVGAPLPDGLELIDVTRKKDVGGLTLMLSAGAGF